MLKEKYNDLKDFGFPDLSIMGEFNVKIDDSLQMDMPGVLEKIRLQKRKKKVR